MGFSLPRTTVLSGLPGVTPSGTAPCRSQLTTLARSLCLTPYFGPSEGILDCCCRGGDGIARMLDVKVPLHPTAAVLDGAEEPVERPLIVVAPPVTIVIPR